jgi:hypothetical protein
VFRHEWSLNDLSKNQRMVKRGWKEFLALFPPVASCLLMFPLDGKLIPSERGRSFFLKYVVFSIARVSKYKELSRS